MCGRYVSPNSAAIERAWQIGRTNSSPFERRYNVQPATQVPLLVLHEGGLVLESARWGLIPHWWKEAKPPRFTFNARLEEAGAKPMWREAICRARCLVPAEGWYEWREVALTDPHSGEIVQAKQPHYLRRRDERPFCFAGLLSAWTKPGETQPQLSCAILTSASAGPVAEVYERMPVVLPDAAHAEWLDPALGGAARVVALARERAAPDEFTHYPVRKLVNSSRNEGPELIVPEEER